MKEFISQEFEDLLATAEANRVAYQEADPFPNIAFENFFNPDLLEKVLVEFPDLQNQDSIKFHNSKEKKFAGKGEKSFGPETRKLMHFLNSEPFLVFLKSLTGIEKTLVGDPYFYGGGLHEIKRGGLLKVHADFNRHDKFKLDRRLNVLVYLNKHWEDAYGGHFELWDQEMKMCRRRILPKFNTLALFSTTDFSYHGHPDPLKCPEGMSRKSLALYYYSNGRPSCEISNLNPEHGTLFKARSGDKDDSEVFTNSRGATIKRVVKELVPPFVIKGIRRFRGSVK
jgi:Rps23 Pro-64 3,4-dihydroxylase Tpa1-like proline 4-hydroxylase